MVTGSDTGHSLTSTRAGKMPPSLGHEFGKRFTSKNVYFALCLSQGWVFDDRLSEGVTKPRRPAAW